MGHARHADAHFGGIDGHDVRQFVVEGGWPALSGGKKLALQIPYPQNQGRVEAEVHIDHLHLRHSPYRLLDLRGLGHGHRLHRLLCGGRRGGAAGAARHQDNHRGEQRQVGQESQLLPYYAETASSDCSKPLIGARRPVSVWIETATQPCRASPSQTIPPRYSPPAPSSLPSRRAPNSTITTPCPSPKTDRK